MKEKKTTTTGLCTWPWISPQTVTGLDTVWTVPSSIKISQTISQRLWDWVGWGEEGAGRDYKTASGTSII